ncbi:hypothetical protein BJ165DRAFT_1534628 [Panaeolus papilionaceus]|nr:hypothetical protein BJ165DRAFT_1534628 [Panaeolus papilionaceus]
MPRSAQGAKQPTEPTTPIPTERPAKPAKRRGRKDTKHFSAHELGLIWPLKADFRLIIGEDEVSRTAYITNNVYPVLYSYWKEMGKFDRIVEPDAIEETWQVLIKKYVRANWRPHVTRSAPRPPSLHITKSNFLYNTRHKDVINEIRAIIKEDEITTGHVTKFRHIAVDNILARMTPREIRKMEEDIEVAKTEGYSPAVQQRIHRKRCHQHVENAARLQYVEMGMVSFQISAAIDAKDQITFNYHDHAAELLGVGISTFRDDAKLEIQALLAAYDAYLQGLLSIRRNSQPDAPNTTPSVPALSSTTTPLTSIPTNTVPIPTPEALAAELNAGPIITPEPTPAPVEIPHDQYKRMAAELLSKPMDGTLPVTDEGFPILPSPWPNHLNKNIQEKIYSRFLWIHYGNYTHSGGLFSVQIHNSTELALGAGPMKGYIPWTALKTHYSKYFHPAYLPKKPIPMLRDSRNTSQGTINAFFTHVSKRQDMLGPDQAFRFLRVHRLQAETDGNPSGAVPTKYPDGNTDDPICIHPPDVTPQNAPLKHGPTPAEPANLSTNDQSQEIGASSALSTSIQSLHPPLPQPASIGMLHNLSHIVEREDSVPLPPTPLLEISRSPIPAKEKKRARTKPEHLASCPEGGDGPRRSTRNASKLPINDGL